MCNHCSLDPRDVVSEAQVALRGLRTLLNQLGPNDDVPPEGVAGIIGLIDDRLSPAVDKLQGYVPRT